MSNKTHEKIKQLLAANELSAEAASKKAGLDRGYLQKLFERPDASPKAGTLVKLAGALGVPVSELLAEPDGGAAIMPKQSQTIRTDVKRADLGLPARHELPNDVPVLGTTAGSHSRGAFQLSNDPIDYVRRPPALAGAKDIYSLFVEGDSMEPQFFPGDLIYVHPHKPPRIGDAVVIQCEVSEATIEATVGIYARRTGETLIVHKHNPKNDIEFPITSIKCIHKVLTINELFGV